MSVTSSSARSRRSQTSSRGSRPNTLPRRVPDPRVERHLTALHTEPTQESTAQDIAGDDQDWRPALASRRMRVRFD